ncbi:NAD(P)-dependent oxidoreductase [Luminiphilus sp.]|nr:NAD(P)-dependent oxidoreductase [Luminiphilus sp.]
MIGILGGSGFLGSTLIRQLTAEAQAVHCFDIIPTHLDVPYTYFDVTSCDPSEDFKGARCIINLAAAHRDDIRPVSRYYDVNVKGAQLVCDAAADAGIAQIVFVSSVAVYGFAPPETDENGDFNYFNEYGRTKLAAETIYREWQQEDPSKRRLIIVRPTVIFGEGNRGNVYNLVRQIASKKFVMFGNGQNFKSMAYVENVASFIRTARHQGPGIHIYNYVDTPDLTMNELVRMTRRTLFGRDNVGPRLPAFLGLVIGKVGDFFTLVSGKSLPVSSIRVKKFMTTTQFSSRAHETGFKPPYSLAEGLERTLRYEFLEDNSGNRTFETE